MEHLNVETIVIHECDPSPRSGSFRKSYSRREAAPLEKFSSDRHQATNCFESFIKDILEVPSNYIKALHEFNVKICMHG